MKSVLLTFLAFLLFSFSSERSQYPVPVYKNVYFEVRSSDKVWNIGAGTRICENPYKSTAANQVWRIIPSGDGDWFYIVNAATAQYLDISQTTERGGRGGFVYKGHAYVRESLQNDNQKFRFKNYKDGYYTIQVKKDGLYLDISQTSNGSGFDRKLPPKGYLYAGGYNGKPNQRFRIIEQ